MGDIKLFRIENGRVKELNSQSVAIEKTLQVKIEKNLKDLIGVDFLASEYGTGKSHRGRIDTIGIDENGCPVIIEYKRALNENVINQGLFYLDWLLDHKAEYEALVRKQLGNKGAEEIEWGSPRLLCIAGDFTRYDEHAVAQIGRNIELLRYKLYGNDLLLLELVNTPASNDSVSIVRSGGKKFVYKTASQMLEDADDNLRELFDSLKAFIEALGDDVQTKTLKYYFAFKRLNNFASVEIRTQTKVLLLYLKLDPKTMGLKEGFTRDVTDIGHVGTGNLEVIVKDHESLERAKELIVRSYNSS